MSATPRHGRIDDEKDFPSFDLFRFNDNVNPFGSRSFIDGAFSQGTEFHRRYVQKSGFSGKQSVADLGCGFGKWSLFLAEVNDKVRGFDLNAGGIDMARKLAPHFGFDNLSFDAADASKLPAEDGEFDAVWCYCALHYFDRAAALTEIHRVLKPDGRLLLGAVPAEGRIFEWFFDGYKKGGAEHRDVALAARMLRAGPLSNKPPTYVTADTIGELLQKFGFQITGAIECSPPANVEKGRANPLFATERANLMQLGERLETDRQFLTEFAAHPEIADFYPRTVNVTAARLSSK